MPNWKKQKDDFGHDGRETEFGKFISSPRSPSRRSPVSSHFRRSDSRDAYGDNFEFLERPPSGKWSKPGEQERDYQQRDYLSSRPPEDSRSSRSPRYRPSNYGMNHSPQEMRPSQDAQSDTGAGYGHSMEIGGSYREEQVRRRFDYEYDTGPYCEFTPGRYSGKGPKGYKRSEERLREDFCEALTRHPDIDASDIEVIMENSELVLRGTVPEREMKYLIDDLAEHSFGMPDIRNEIRIRRDRSETHSSETESSFVESANLPLAKTNKKPSLSPGSNKSDLQ
ncbi:MAG: BON domain-containing protein [Pseudobdellovibrionaceae bacterium]